MPEPAAGFNGRKLTLIHQNELIDGVAVRSRVIVAAKEIYDAPLTSGEEMLELES